MGLYYVVRPNPLFKVGEFLRDSDEGFVQRTVMTKEGPSGWTGILVPRHEVRPFTVKILRRGLDFRRGGALG